MDWTDWKLVASSKPTQWEVPTYIEVTHAPKDCASLLGVYHHTPQFFNIDVYKQLGEDIYMYYYYKDDNSCGWRTAGKHAAKLNGCADPNSQALGSGDHYPSGSGGSSMGRLRWRGDGRHYAVKGDTPRWAMRFCFDANENCRLGVDWEHWDEMKDSLKPTMMTLPVSEAGVEDVLRGLESLMDETDFAHVEQIAVETPTTVRHYTYILRDARIQGKKPSQGCGGYESTDTPTKEKRRLQIKMFSGVVATLDVPAPHTVALIKEMLAAELEIPVFAQCLMIEGEVSELSDEDQVSVESLLLIQKELPMISTVEFLESLVYCIPEWTADEILQRWYPLDIYEPTNNHDLLQRLITKHKAMKHVPLTKDNICECLDIWMELNEKAGAHPEAFLKDVDRLVSFFEEYCFSPSLLQVYSEVYVDDDVEFLFFFAARLRCEPQTLMVLAMDLNTGF